MEVEENEKRRRVKWGGGDKMRALAYALSDLGTQLALAS